MLFRKSIPKSTQKTNLILNVILRRIVLKVVAKYQEYYHGFKRLFAKYGITQYLIEPVEGKTDRRLFMSVLKRRKCKEQTDLIDPDTGIKIDFVCD